MARTRGVNRLRIRFGGRFAARFPGRKTYSKCDKCGQYQPNGHDCPPPPMTATPVANTNGVNGHQTNGFVSQLKTRYTSLINGDDDIEVDDNEINDNEVDDHQVVRCETKCTPDGPSTATVWPTRPLESVRGLANEIATIDASDEVILRSVLYAVLEKNDFSTDGSLRLLEEARRAITESLVLPAFDDNRQTRLNAEEFEYSLDDSIDSPQVSDRVYKAKKSFPPKVLSTTNRRSLRINSETNGDHLLNASAVKASDISVKANERRLEKCDSKTSPQRLTSSPLIISPKMIVSTQTQTEMTAADNAVHNITNFSHAFTPFVPQNSVLVSQLRRPVTIAPKPSNSSTSLSTCAAISSSTPSVVTHFTLNSNQSTYMLMPVQTTTNTSVAATNANPTLTPIKIQFPVKPVAQVVITSGANTSAGPTVIQPIAVNTSPVSLNASPVNTYTRTPATSLTATSPRFIRLSTPSAQQKQQPLSSPPVSTVSANNLTANKLSIRKTGRDILIRNVGVKSFPQVFNKRPVETSSADTGPKRSKLCAKIITNEAALAALTAFSGDSNSTFADVSDASVRIVATADNEYILPDHSDDSVDTVVIQESRPTHDLRSSKSTKLLTHSQTNSSSAHQLFNSSHQSMNASNLTSNLSTINIFKSNNANKTKDIVQITID